MDTASKPSASAMRIAATAMSSRLKRGRRPAISPRVHTASGSGSWTKRSSRSRCLAVFSVSLSAFSAALWTNLSAFWLTFSVIFSVAASSAIWRMASPDTGPLRFAGNSVAMSYSVLLMFVVLCTIK